MKAQLADRLRLATTCDEVSGCLSMRGLVSLPEMMSLPAIGLLPVEGAGGAIGVLAPRTDAISLSRSVCDNCLTYATNTLVLNLSPGRVLKI